MPTYEYLCHKCGVVQEVIHSIKETPVITCEKCPSKEPLERLISHNISGFILKGGTAAIHWKEKRLKMKKRAELGVKQIDRFGSEGGTKLKPNVGGTEVESWSDASKLAKEAGLNTESYKPMVEKEKNLDKSGSIDNRTWKAAKESKDKA
jgi:putative FmdB family regulatory protein